MAETVRLDPRVAGGGLDDANDATVALSSGAPPRRARRCPTCKQMFSGDSRFCPFDGDPLVDAPEWNPRADAFIGQVVDGRYEVVSVLGEGGMGTVYEARHKTLGRRFALKVLRRDIADKELTARFIQEAKAAAAIGHPNIVAVSDFGTVAGPRGGEVPYFVMEHLTGRSLSQVLAVERCLSPARAAGILRQCAAGLAAAHAAGVIHRDLKPDNVFVLESTPESIKLLDFGVAKIAGAGRLTQAGTVFGTPHYMSPEQAAGNAVDHRADIYALGVILYECLSGHVPFEADSYMGVLTKHMFAAPDPIEKVVTDASGLGALGPLVMRCLAKEPAERFASMAELGEALEAFTRKREASLDGRAAGRRGSGRGSLVSGSGAVSEARASAAEDPGDTLRGLSPPVNRIWPYLVVPAVLAVVAGVGWYFASGPRVSSTIATTTAPGAPGPTATAEATAAPTSPPPPAAAETVAPAPSASASSAPAPSATAAEKPAARPRPTPPRAPAKKPGRKSGDVVDPWGH